MKPSEPMRLSHVVDSCLEIMRSMGNLEVKVYDTNANRLRSAVMNFGQQEGQEEPNCVVFIDKKSLLKIPPK